MRYLTPVRIDETKKRNKARHAFSMIRQGIRDDVSATTTAEKLAAQKKKMAGQARSGRAYWGAYAAKETAASKNEKDPIWKRQTASNLADWAKEKGQQAKGRQNRVSDSIVPLTMNSLMESETNQDRINAAVAWAKANGLDSRPLSALSAYNRHLNKKDGGSRATRKKRYDPIPPHSGEGPGSTKSKMDDAGDSQ